MNAGKALIRKTTGLDIDGGSTGQPQINISGIFNAQTITGIIMTGYSKIGRKFGLPMTGKAGTFGRQAILWGATTGLFSGGNASGFNSSSQGITTSELEVLR